jgi:hypothetical protein
MILHTISPASDPAMAESAPEQQVEIIRGYSETFMRRDLAAMRRHMAPGFIQRHINIRRDFIIEEEMGILETVLACSCIVFPGLIS